jgi:hypothetical protein
MKKMLMQLRNFTVEVYSDKRIPKRDKKVFIGILVLILARILFIPDWIPLFGILDVLILLGICSDYCFSILDQNVLLSHYPWGMKSFARFKRIALFLAFFAPEFITDRLWEYTKEPF